MLAQAAGFAVLAALSPTALLITAVYLGSAQPRTTVLCYLAGAVLVSTVLGIGLLLVLRYGHFQLPGNRTPRYGLRLGLGLLILAAIAVAFIWLPFLAYLAAPELTTRKLTAFNGWLRAHGRILLSLALLVAGVILVVNGLVGLIRA